MVPARLLMIDRSGQASVAILVTEVAKPFKGALWQRGHRAPENKNKGACSSCQRDLP